MGKKKNKELEGWPHGTKILDMDEFYTKIVTDHSFKNMGVLLKLRGSRHAFLYKDDLYKAYYSPESGNNKITYWKAKNETKCEN